MSERMQKDREARYWWSIAVIAFPVALIGWAIVKAPGSLPWWAGVGAIVMLFAGGLAVLGAYVSLATLVYRALKAGDFCSYPERDA